MSELDEIRIADRKHIGLAEMLKGGVIMDVTTAEQAKIAEDAGAASVMALERVPADIRKDGGVARMASVTKIKEIQKTVSIPVMAKARIGHFVEAQILEALGVDFIDESEVLTPADEHFHIDKFAFRIPFVCGARDLGEALRRIGEGAAMIRTKGEAGSGHDPLQGRGRARASERGARRGDGRDRDVEARREGPAPDPGLVACGSGSSPSRATSRCTPRRSPAAAVRAETVRRARRALRSMSRRSWSASPRSSRPWAGSSSRAASPPRSSSSWTSGSLCRRSRSSTR